MRSDSGQMATALSLVAPAMLLVSAMAVNFIYEIKIKNDLQAALDAGTLAGTVLTAGATPAQRLDAAQKAFDANFTGNGKMTSGTSAYSVVSNARMSKFWVTDWAVSGEAAATVANPFSGILGGKDLDVKATAAAAKMESEPICVLGLDPESKATIDMSGQPTLTAKNCVVQANSSDGEGIRQKGQPELKGKRIGITGGYSGDGYSPLPTKGTIPFADPFKSVPFPKYSFCDYNDVKVSSSDVSLEPGTYCGGIRINAGGVVYLKPGIYVLKDGPLWITGGGSISGEEVTIAFTGPDATLYMNGTSTLALTSPKAGPYANMQFTQEPGTGGDDLYFSVVGNNSFTVDGAVYLPTFDVWFAGGTVASISSPSYALVADKIWVQDQSNITVTYENKRGVRAAVANGFKYGARLVQ